MRGTDMRNQKTMTFACQTVAFAICLISLASSSATAADVEAYVGQPFGVGRVTVPVLRGARPCP